MLRHSFTRLVIARSYITRAHPKPTTELSVKVAVQELLDDVQERLTILKKKKRSTMDETVELAVNLNLDPRKPGQSLRGSVSLPNGTGKTINCIVFTTNTDLQEQCKQIGATVGGEALVDQIVNGEFSVDTLDRALATPDVMPILSKKAARLLGPRGLMPNAKNNTLIQTPEDLVDSLKNQIAGKDVVYRTEKSGIVHVPVGKSSFGTEKILENIGAVMQEIFEVKPESYGKGKKSGKAVGKGTKYLLRASVTTTQGKGKRLDLRTVDPSSAFFLSSVEEATSDEASQNQAA